MRLSDNHPTVNFDKSTLILPILASVLLHTVIIIAVAAPLITPPTKPNTAIQTALVGQEAFNSAKTALSNHHANQNTPTAANASSTITANDNAFMQAQNQHRYRPQVSTSATTTQAYHPLPNSAPFESNSPNIQNQPTNAHAKLAKYSNNDSGLEQANHTESTPSRTQINAAISSVKQRIEAIWQRYPKQPNQTITFQVNIDQQGDVTSIQFGGGHPDLRESVEAAVYAAAPFYELGGMRDSIRLQFTTEQLIMDNSQTPNEPNH